MASIELLEKDYTRSVIYNPTDTIVYIPGLFGRVGNVNVQNSSLLNVPTLFDNTDDFTSKIGLEPYVLQEGSSETQPVYDKSYIIARTLLSMGMKVLYEVVLMASTEKPQITYDDVVATLSSTEESIWTKLTDRSLYNIRFLTSGGYSAIQGTDTAIATNMLSCAYYRKATENVGTGRGDCVALIDHPKDIYNIDDVYSILTDVLNNLGDMGSFGTMFTPWCQFTNILITEGDVVSEDGKTSYWALPGSVAYLLSYNQMIGSNNPTYFADAGITRGAVPLLNKPLFEIGEVAARAIQTRQEGAVCANPIMFINGYGYRIYGNRTLLQIQNGLKATSFLNIRNLISDIKKTCFTACRLQTFEQNTDVLWANLKASITPLLDKMASGQGISGYKIVRVATKEKAKVVGKIQIIPIEAVEDFELTIELYDSLETEVES